MLGTQRPTATGSPWPSAVSRRQPPRGPLPEESQGAQLVMAETYETVAGADGVVTQSRCGATPFGRLQSLSAEQLSLIALHVPLVIPLGITQTVPLNVPPDDAAPENSLQSWSD